ncbi:hypothetical protein WDW86_08520 [Bdellovibrionota bacterium FG-2]
MKFSKSFNLAAALVLGLSWVCSVKAEQGKIALPTFGKTLGGNTSGGGNDETTLAGLLPKTIHAVFDLEFYTEGYGYSSKPIFDQHRCYIFKKCDIFPETMRLSSTLQLASDPDLHYETLDLAVTYESEGESGYIPGAKIQFG